MANISSQFKKASELYQRAVQQYQVKQKEQRALIDQFKVGDHNAKVKLKPQLIALHKDMQYHQELVDRAEAAFEKALAGEPIDLGEDVVVKNKKTGNVYSVKKANPAVHTKATPNDIAKAKSDNGGQVKAEPTKGLELDIDKQSHINDIPKKFRSMVSMKIDQLAKAASEAKAKGEKAPNFNLCDITIPGTNLYCKGNKGIPREDMPQFKGYAKPGSIADKLPKNNDGEVDTESQFKVLLKKNGVAVSEPQSVAADQLKATQTELVGAKVAGMTKALETEPNHPKITAPIYVSNDGYVLDGHHRWAAVTSSAVASGKPAMMNVRVIDMPIKDLVKISNDFADQIGIQQKKADANAEAPKKEVTEVTTNDWHYKAIMAIWDRGGSFTRKKIGTILLKDPNASRRDIENELRNSDYDEVTDVTDRLRIESIITEKQFKGLDGIPANTSLEKISKDQKLKIIKAPGNIVDFIVPKGVSRNFWQVMGTGKIKKNTDGQYYLEGKVINSPMFKSVDDLINGVKWDSMESRRRFNEGIIKEEDSEETLKGLKEMAMGDLERIEDYAEMISDRMQEGQDLESWMYSQITLAVDQLNSVHDAMDGNDGVKESVIKEDFPGKGKVVLAKDINQEMMNYFDRTNVKLEVTPISGNKYSASVGPRFGDIFFHGNGAPNEATWRLQLKKIKSVKILGYYGDTIKEDMDTTEDESGMFISNIKSTMESAQSIQQTIQSKGENFDVPAWVQAKTALASDYLHSISRYYKGNPNQD